MSFLRIILFPFAIIFDAVTRLRNHLYNSGYRTSFLFGTTVISVGNLSVGGTGKTPMVEYLIRLLSGKRQITMLSRGYGRKTKGFRMAQSDASADTIGDEPYQIFRKFNKVHIAVGEERAVAIPFILAECPDTEVILLDDAFQHRAVQPSFSILLTEYNKPFFTDHLLPAGRLRESRRGAKRADIIVVTKCPPAPKFNFYEHQIRKYNSKAEIVFSNIRYASPIAIKEASQFSNNVLLLSGIANPLPLRVFIRENYHLIGEIIFNDHHHYTRHDINKISGKFNQLRYDQKCIITTEKDAVKLNDFLNEKGIDLPVFYLPIETSFIKGGKTFDNMILNSLESCSN